MDLSLFIQCLINGLMIGGIYALVASGFTLILGVMKIFNFAQGQFYMLGAFVAYAVSVTLGLPYIVALIISTLSMGVLGILVYIGIIRWTYTGFFHTIMATIAFGTISKQSSLLTFGYREKVLPAVVRSIIQVSNITLSGGKLFIISVAIIIMTGLHYFMKRKVGTSMRTVAESIDVASLQGINPTRIFLLTMGVGCGLCGIAGGLIAPVLCASVLMGDHIFIMVLLVIFIGGMGSMTGALLASFVIGVVESFAYQFVGELNLVVIFIFMAVLAYFRPGGLLGKPLPIPTAE
jgi:branched-subunit amino acid ABC-type transport system permease component